MTSPRKLAAGELPESTIWTRGTGFLVSLWAILLFVAFGCAVVHWRFLPAQRTMPPVKELVALDDLGRIESLSDLDLRWYVGRDAATAIETTLKSNSEKIDAASAGEVRQSILEIELKFSAVITAVGGKNKDSCSGAKPPCFEEIHKAFDAGDFERAAKSLRELVGGWSPDTQAQIGQSQLFTLIYDLEQLASLKRSQRLTLKQIKIPGIQGIFWVRPKGALAEAIIWSILGTLVNLIVNMAHYRARGKFRSSEAWISVSKLIYGPILSLVLVLWIYFGIINASVEVRFWLLPLLGFLFGYNTRKTAILIDRLSDKIFDTLGASIDSFNDDSPTQAVKDGASQVAAAAKPTSIGQMATMAPTVTEAHITSALTAKNN